MQRKKITECLGLPVSRKSDIGAGCECGDGASHSADKWPGFEMGARVRAVCEVRDPWMEDPLVAEEGDMGTVVGRGGALPTIRFDNGRVTDAAPREEIELARVGRGVVK